MSNRLKTAIPELDLMLGGGFYPKSSVLIEGSSGTGKTTLGLEFIYNGITKYNEPGLIISFEEFPQLFYRDASNFNWDLKKLEQEDKLRVILISPDILIKEMSRPQGMIDQLVQEMSIKRVLIDSISHFQQLAIEPYKLRELFNTLVNGFKRLGITLFLISENSCFTNYLVDSSIESVCSLVFLVDTVVCLRYVEMESMIKKAIVVLKHRGSSHDKSIREFDIDADGIKINGIFKGKEGIMFR